MDEILFDLTIRIDDIGASDRKQVDETIRRVREALENIGLAPDIEADIYDDED